MSTEWEKIFSKSQWPWKDGYSFADSIDINSLETLKNFLDFVHIRHCLVKPYFEEKNYPLVEARELLPSFEGDMWEYKNLPGFSLVAFARPLEYFSEIFQYDMLYPIMNSVTTATGASCPLEGQVIAQNVQTMAARLPRFLHESFRAKFNKVDTAVLDYYPALLPFLLNMDRGQVLALDSFGQFHLAGIFASFPSDIDNELKRFGMRIGKFEFGDNEMYERNRMFVYQYLMELYGFPIVSERRTSSALFARRLHKIGEHFLLRVLGQSDRTLTTYISTGEARRYPHLEKIALIKVDPDQEEALTAIRAGGFFLDAKKRVVIIRIHYRQHGFNSSNVQQDRALSVSSQEIIHPYTGDVLRGLNIIKDTTNMFLRLNDIVRGEFTGRILYKRTEIIENTDTEDKRLKFLYTWLSKHQRRIIGYSDNFFANVSKVVTSYLNAPENDENFEQHRELHREVCTRFSYIQQARKVRILEDLGQRMYKGVRISYRKMMLECLELLNELRFEIVDYFPPLVDAIVDTIENILSDTYLVHSYIDPAEDSLTRAGAEIRKHYGRLISLLDIFKAVRKSRYTTESGRKGTDKNFYVV
ncbi:MAG: hypothetical protein RRY29_01430 [Desulfovibrionaceae bacterium]